MDAAIDPRIDAFAPGLDTGVPGDAPRPIDGGSDTGPLCVDADEDGFFVGPASCGETDCDDADADVNPGNVEACNGVDDDCNGMVDDAILDQVCGVGGCETTVPGCVDGDVPTCTAGDPSDEICNAIDDDCNGTVDDDLGAPIVCGTGACERMVPGCAGGGTMTCTPGTPGLESCNGIDDDCDGTTDESLPTTTCGIGACRQTVSTCVDGAPRACVPGTPGVEACNGIDDDCNGTADDGFGTATCGTGTCSRTVSTCVMGMPQMCMPGTAGTEICNNLDDDCDGTPDDGLGSSSCGLGACARTVMNCLSGVPQTCTPGSAVPESCNGADDDCNGVTDDMGTTSCGVGLCTRTVSNCVSGVPQTCVPGLATGEVCGNGLDDNCNGTVDDGCITAPANDLCAGAILLSGASGTRTADSITGATAQVTDCAYGNDVWYRITLAARSILYVDTFGSSFDTSLSIRSSCAGAPAACEDDDCGVLQDIAVADLPAGTHYVVVHTRASTTGTVNLRWQTLATGNGTSTRVIANGASAGTTSGTGITSASCGSFSSGPENLHYFTACPSTTRSITAATCSAATWDTVLYSRSAGGTEISCNDDGCDTRRSTITQSVTGPGLFGVFVDGYSGASGAYTVTFSGL